MLIKRDNTEIDTVGMDSETRTDIEKNNQFNRSGGQSRVTLVKNNRNTQTQT